MAVILERIYRMRLAYALNFDDSGFRHAHRLIVCGKRWLLFMRQDPARNCLSCNIVNNRHCWR